jgi:IPT/TIG domain
VSIDGIEAVCDSLDCGYNYVAPVSLITGFTYDGATLTITGSALTSTIQSVQFSHIDCTNIQSTSTQITCQVTAVAGSWSPIVTDASGIIPIDASATPISVSLSVSSVSPSASLNPFGGTILTITGSSLPHATTEGNNYSVTFSDGSICDVVSISSTLIRCITGKFDVSSSTNPSLTVTVNGVTDSSKSVNVRTDPTKVVSITPNSVSPVLKTLLTIKVSGYPNTLDKNDLEVFAVARTRNIVTPINVVEVGVDGADQYMKVKFGGSESSVYDLRVKSR